MANRLSHNLLHQTRRRILTTTTTTTHHRLFIRPLNLIQPITVTDPTTTHLQPLPQPNHLQHPPSPIPIPTTQTPILDLTNPQKLFSTIPSSKLLKSATTLQLVSSNHVVDFGLWITRSKLMNAPITGNLIKSVIKPTFFDQFVAGEDLDETTRTIKRLTDSDLHAMLAYGAEHAHDEVSAEKNFDEFVNSVQFSHSLPSSSVSFVIVKISAICPIELLSRVSDHLRWQKQHQTSLQWKRQTLPIFTNSSPLYHTLHQPPPLTPHEETLLSTTHSRLTKLSSLCSQHNIPLAVDAEDTFVQPAIDYLTCSSALEFNKMGNKPVVYGTIQAYLKDAKERLVSVTEAAGKSGVSIGFKLVRGAYMSSECKTAKELGVESPIHKCVKDTHECYNDCASYLIDKVKDGSTAVVLATHNVESGQLAARKAVDAGLAGKKKTGKDNRVEFAQLYGMSDVLSYGLSNAGFNVSKYLTFGPVEEVMPYLLRRAEENRGVLSSSTLDRTLMWKELRRRMTA